MKLYVAGPMSNLPKFGFPAFDEAAALLRERGHDVVTPSELDSPEHREVAMRSATGDPAEYNAATGETWGDLLARDVKLISDGGIEGVVALPGWEGSRGARLETYIAHALHGLPVYDYAAWRASRDPLVERFAVPRVRLAAAWAPPAGGPPDGGEVREVSASGGEKGSKPQRMDLIPWGAVLRVSEVYGFGARKYSPGNWRRGYSWGLSYAALMRHLAAWWEGQDGDPESGLSHLAHAGFHVMTLLTFSAHERYAELDDRPKGTP